MPNAPLPDVALERVLRPQGEALTLPAAAYLDEAVLAWEHRYVFAGGWTCLGRVAEVLPPDTAQRAVEVGDVGVLLTVHEGRIQAFANVCRHRGHELLATGTGATGRRVRCPYHGWSYTLDGALRTAPRMGDGFDGTGYGLVELPARDWHGWLFVNASGTAPDFDAWLGGLAGLLAPYRAEDLVVAASHTYRVAANWKLIAENYHECYHCPSIHPELCRVSPPDSGENWALPGAWVGGSMLLRDGADTMSLDGRSAARALPGVDPRTVRYVGLLPNLLVSAHPDYVLTHRLVPLAPALTRVECAWLFPPGVADPGYAVRFWDLTNRQDWAACESVQRGVSSPHYRPGPLAPQEDAVHRWMGMLARVYRDPDAGLAAACAG